MPTLLFFFLFTLLFSVNANICISNPSSSSCPPFTSTHHLPFPFSSYPNCAHPSFHLTCTSVLSINNLSFALLHFDTNSSTLLLSPITNSSTTNCSSTTIPPHPINLSASPFRFSDSSCSRLSVLSSCSPPSLPNCSHCPWHCSLIKNPTRLLHGCATSTTRGPISEQGCQSDVLEYLDDFLKNGVLLEYDESQDPYFTGCRDCQSRNGICGFNSSDLHQSFICSQSKARLTPPWMHGQDRNRVVILCSIFTLFCLALVVLVIAVIFRSTVTPGVETD